MSARRLRHSLLVRSCHWLLAVSGLMLCFTGIGTMPLYPRFYVNELPGLGWSADMLLQLQMHYLFAGVFTAVGSLHLLYHFRRREFGLLPRKGDLGESWQTIKAMFTSAKEPCHGKFLAEQRLVYALYLLLSVLLLGTGWFLAFRQLYTKIIDPELLQAATLLHLICGMLFFTGFLFHLLAFLLKTNRPLFLSMFHGQVNKVYTRKRHPRWAEDQN